MKCRVDRLVMNCRSGGRSPRDPGLALGEPCTVMSSLGLGSWRGGVWGTAEEAVGRKRLEETKENWLECL